MAQLGIRLLARRVESGVFQGVLQVQQSFDLREKEAEKKQRRESP